MYYDEALFEDPSIFFDEAILNNNVMDEAKSEAKSVKRRIKNGHGGSSESKKSANRDTERQRRREMAALCASLRSLLPLEYVKGKRGTCDHMEQAVNYINDIQKNIQQTKMRRNKLKKLSTSQIPNINCDSSVMINILRDDGMEILITTPLYDECCFPLSKVLACLLGFGLNVTTYDSTTADHCSFHKLHIEVNEITSIEISELKERLLDLIKLA